MTITGSYNDDLHSPGWDLALSGLTGTAYYKVVRRDLSGGLPDFDARLAGVGEDGLKVFSSDTDSLSDYEFSFEVNLQYRLDKYDSSKILTSTDTFTAGLTPAPTGIYPGAAWLKSVYTPSSSAEIFPQMEMGTYSRKGRGVALDVLGRSNPVVITDVLSGRSGSLPFIAADMGQFFTPTAFTYDNLFDPGDVLFFQSMDPASVGMRDFYLIVSSFDMRRETLAYSNDPVFIFTINYTEVDRPSTTTIDVSVSTWQDVLDNNADWQENLDDHTDWQDVYTNPTA